MKSLAKFLLLILCFVLQNTCFCQCPQSITFISQNEIDNFPIQHPNCTDFTGQIIIEGYDIVDLSPLIQINSANQLWVRECPNLKNLSGLNGLDSVSTYLIIEFNDSLEDLTGLVNLQFVGSVFEISNNLRLEIIEGFSSFNLYENDLLIKENNSLTSIIGFQNLEYTNGTISIWDNPLLNNLIGFENLKTIDNLGIEGLNIIDLTPFSLLDSIENLSLSCPNPAFSFDGLENLVSIGQLHLSDIVITDFSPLQSINELSSLTIDNCSNLANLSFLSQLHFLSGNITISNNPVLLNLNGLHNIDSISGFLNVSNNAIQTLSAFNTIFNVGSNLTLNANNNLIDIDGFANLNFIGGNLTINGNQNLENLDSLNHTIEVLDYISFQNNPKLANCNIQPICERIHQQLGYFFVVGNDNGCETITQVQESCGFFTTVYQTFSNINSFYPNPASSSLNINKETTIYKVKIYSLLGNFIKEFNVIGNIFILDIQNLLDGLYVVHFLDDYENIKFNELLLVKH
jgi:hypothetical protein